jgi:hypothetical protein
MAGEKTQTVREQLVGALEEARPLIEAMIATGWTVSRGIGTDATLQHISDAIERANREPEACDEPCPSGTDCPYYQVGLEAKRGGSIAAVIEDATTSERGRPQLNLERKEEAEA